jgi:zinc transport system ATP-binding protein
MITSNHTQEKETILEVKDLSVTLGGEKIINNLSFKVISGEILTLLGPNGSGKSILLKALLELMSYEGKIIWKQPAKISYLPQGFNQLRLKDFPMTVIDFFALKPARIKQQDITASLQLVGLDQKILNKSASNLSGGEFQRMMIAWSLVSNPQVLLFDEPTSGIDISGEETIYSLLRDIQQKKELTILLVTHDLNIVYKYSTHVLCLGRKGYTCFGSPKETLNTDRLHQLYGKEIKFY